MTAPDDGGPPVEEIVLTSRRAWIRTPAGPATVRLRISDRRLRLDAPDGPVADVPLGTITAVRLLRLPRPAVEVRTAGSVLRLRCFAPSAMVALIEGVRADAAG